MLKSPTLGSTTETEVLLVNWFTGVWLKHIREVQKRSRMLVCAQLSPKSRLLRSAKCDKVQRLAKRCWLACFWSSQSSVARSPKGAWMGVDGPLVVCPPLCYHTFWRQPCWGKLTSCPCTHRVWQKIQPSLTLWRHTLQLAQTMQWWGNIDAFPVFSQRVLFIIAQTNAPHCVRPHAKESFFVSTSWLFCLRFK